MKQWNDPSLYRLYLVTDHNLSRGRTTVDIVGQALDGGVSIIQLRDKGKSTRELLDTGREVRNLCSAAGRPFIVNDRIDIALALQADGVHLGQDDMPMIMARRLMGPEKIIGISISSIEEAKQAALDGADYIALNGIFPTETKKDLGPPLGLAMIAEIRRHCSCPLVGIGGITVDNASEVIMAGCDGIAVVSAITMAEAISLVCQEFLQRIETAVVRKKGAFSPHREIA